MAIAVAVSSELSLHHLLAQSVYLLSYELALH